MVLFTFIIVSGPSPPFGNTCSSHMLLDLKKVYTVLMKFDEIRSKFCIVLSNSI